MPDLVVVGASGHGREIFGIVAAINGAAASAATSASGDRWEVVGFVDDAPSDSNRERVERLGSKNIGPVDLLAGAGPDTHLRHRHRRPPRTSRGSCGGQPVSADRHQPDLPEGLRLTRPTGQ
jgi:hypothetical protein